MYTISSVSGRSDGSGHGKAVKRRANFTRNLDFSNPKEPVGVESDFEWLLEMILQTSEEESVSMVMPGEECFLAPKKLKRSASVTEMSSSVSVEVLSVDEQEQ
uniref:Uncharacterized protein n=1 Tax=Rhodosorus marinus TaxID=101924 RepID=A0A6T6N3J3_9RHOD|mmetsp:Transcript_20174/g.29283  ORF Transcript_20174/g.29283 Transcript_20174/m.29283 type:complete len:103 (+) Transcript_20174:243-551(+)|eukprot:CAMPEP_0184751928 /NCGR_PEP_ID=MMETSP0315-20130426/43311_1 /TAXON_ID=101924 /ORGANISM="Rhodosorus marinus, Strain UTEX LB 2760" /LENGTH=102 /DNA_ID=CAMNT_0027231231 /DNA_START=200 /DNA_END=508 /DNA_ORIENTATION=-